LAGFEYASDVSSTITQVTKWITATSNTFYLTLYCWSATTTGVYCDYDNISVREVTGTNTIYTATGDYTTKDSNLILSGATNYYYPQRPSGDYGRIVMAADSKYDTKIIKYLDAKRGRSYLLGPELVTNGNFSAWSGDNPTSWTLGFTEDANTYITQASGGAQLVTTGSLASMSQNLGLSSTKSYVFSIGLSSAITGGLKVGYTAGGADVLSAYATIGITQKVISAPTSAYLYITRQSVGVAANITISLVSVREILL
jgi:hypothetical protein